MSRFRIRVTDAQKAWREDKVEDHGRKLCKDLGGRAYKFVSPAKRSVPDRLIDLPGSPLFFIEYKRWNAGPSEGQEREITHLLERGKVVYVIDNIHEAEQVLRSASVGIFLPMRDYSCPKSHHLYDQFTLGFLR